MRRRFLCRGLAHRRSSSPGLVLQNSHRHFIHWTWGICIRTVTSGRLGAKRLRLSGFLSEGLFSVLWGNSNITDFWFVVSHNIIRANKRTKSIVIVYEDDSSCKWACWKVRSARIPTQHPENWVNCEGILKLKGTEMWLLFHAALFTSVTALRLQLYTKLLLRCTGRME